VQQNNLDQCNPEKVWNALTNIDQCRIGKPTSLSQTKRGAKAKLNFRMDKRCATIHQLFALLLFQSFGLDRKNVRLTCYSYLDDNKSKQSNAGSVDESMEGLLAKLFKNMFNKNLDKSLQTWLDLLKRECEK